MAVVLGVFPKLLLDYTDATVGGFVDRLNPAQQAAQLSANEQPMEVAKPQAAATVETHAAPRDEVAGPQAAGSVASAALATRSVPPVAKVSP